MQLIGIYYINQIHNLMVNITNCEAAFSYESRINGSILQNNHVTVYSVDINDVIEEEFTTTYGDVKNHLKWFDVREFMQTADGS